MNRASRARVWRRLVAVALGLGAALSLTMTASPVHAETTLVTSSPADGEKLISAPLQITATFSAAVPNNAVLTAVCEGSPAPLGTVTVGADGISLIAPITGSLPVGTCNVTYSVPQADGKVATGGFSFEILNPDTANPADVGGDDTDGGMLAVDPPPVSGPLGLARVVAYAALAALFGAAAFMVMAWPEGVDYINVRRYMRTVWVIALVSNYIVAVLRTSLMSGKSVTAAISPFSWSDLFDNASGISAFARVLLIAGSFIIIARPERLLDPQSQPLAVGLPAAAMATFAFTRTVDEFSLLGVVSGIVHTLSIGLWFGGLLVLGQTVLVGPGDDDVAQAVRGYARWIRIFVMAAVISGLISLYSLDGGSVLTSRHGRLIVFKAVGVAAMVYLGVALRQYIARNIAKRRDVNGRTAAKLRRAVMAEAGFGVFVLIVTSWAVATLPPNVDPPGTDKTNYAFVGERSGGVFDVQVKVTPAKVGANAVRIDVYSPAQGMTDLTVQFNPPTNTTASITLSVPLDGAGAARLPMKEGVPFGAPGLWTVIVTANGPDGPLPSVTYAVSVMSGSGGSTDTTIATSGTTVPAQTGGTVVVPLGSATVPAGIQPVTASVAP
ncbi:MAG: copper resistance CopC/CopD family protein [Ilumatobacteraceae bacterium]